MRFLASSPRQVTLVIDDGPTDDTRELMDVLERDGHRAVFFVLGHSIAGREEILVDALRRGFVLGNHSFDHPRFSEIGLDEARDQIVRTDALIGDIHRRARIPRRGKWFRFPYLDTGKENGKAQFEGLQALLAELDFVRPDGVGLRLEVDDEARRDWPTTLNTQDWAEPEEHAFRRTVRRARLGDIVEFHDKPISIRRYAAPLVEELSARSLRAVAPARRFAFFQ
jgi:peptidoglycan/xylan/chitin deacetylase (PgdA/CDA1 family)